MDSKNIAILTIGELTDFNINNAIYSLRDILSNAGINPDILERKNNCISTLLSQGIGYIRVTNNKHDDFNDYYKTYYVENMNGNIYFNEGPSVKLSKEGKVIIISFITEKEKEIPVLDLFELPSDETTLGYEMYKHDYYLDEEAGIILGEEIYHYENNLSNSKITLEEFEKKKTEEYSKFNIDASIGYYLLDPNGYESFYEYLRLKENAKINKKRNYTKMK